MLWRRFSRGGYRPRHATLPVGHHARGDVCGSRLRAAADDRSEQPARGACVCRRLRTGHSAGVARLRLLRHPQDSTGQGTLTVRQPFPLPWYQFFPLDFVTENLIPWEIRDERVVDLAMVPASSTPPESVVARAEQARFAAGSLPPAEPARVVPIPAVPQPVPAPRPTLPPLQQYQPQPLPPPQGFQPPPGQGIVLPPQPPVSPWQGLQPPSQNSPQQGIPSLGLP